MNKIAKWSGICSAALASTVIGLNLSLRGVNSLNNLAVNVGALGIFVSLLGPTGAAAWVINTDIKKARLVLKLSELDETYFFDTPANFTDALHMDIGYSLKFLEQQVKIVEREQAQFKALEKKTLSGDTPYV